MSQPQAIAGPTTTASFLSVVLPELRLRVAHAALLLTRNPVIPALENVLLRLDPPKTKYSTARTLRVIGSCLEHTFVSAPLTVTEPVLNGVEAVCVPAGQLNKLLAQLPGINARLELRAGPENQSGLRELSIRTTLPATLLGEGQTGQGKYTLIGDSPDDFPRTPSIKADLTVHVSARLLLDGLKFTLPVCSTDELRPAMTGILVEIGEQGLTLVATDGHRLVRFSRTAGALVPTGTARRRFVLPHRAGVLLTKLLLRNEQIQLHLSGDSHLLIICDAGQLHIRLIEEKYPDYENILPSVANDANTLLAHRLELLAAVKRADLFASAGNHELAFVLNETTCQLTAKDRDMLHCAAESVPGRYEGRAMTIGFNARMLQGLLLAMPCQNVRLIAGDLPSRAVLLLPEAGTVATDELLCLLMPVLLNDSFTDSY